MNDDHILVSVVLLTYNHSAYIRQAIESVLMQKTDFAWELLIGEDASTDGTAKIVEEMAQQDHRICAYLRKENLGATRNLYDLVSRAKGEYIAYLEGDDYWCDEMKLQRQADFLKSHPEYGGCTHPCRIVNENGKLCAKQNLSWEKRKTVYTLKDFKGVFLAGHGNCLMHKNFYKDSGDRYKKILTLHPLIGDRATCLLAAHQGPIFRLDQEMVCYRVATSENRSNATAVAYEKNPTRVRDDYLFTKALEKEAERLGIRADFSFHINMLFTSMVGLFLKKPDRENRKFIVRMLKENNPFGMLLFFPYGIWRKLWRK